MVAKKKKSTITKAKPVEETTVVEPEIQEVDTKVFPELSEIVKVISSSDIIHYVNSHPDSGFTVGDLKAYFTDKGYRIF